MSSNPENVKLASLRARTDRELVAIIQGNLERGLHLARQHSNGGTAEAHRAEAEQAHAEAAKLLPLVYSLSQPERRRLEASLTELESALQTSTRYRSAASP